MIRSISKQIHYFTDHPNTLLDTILWDHVTIIGVNFNKFQVNVKLYPNLCHAIADALHAIFTGNKHADKVIEKTLRQNPKWGARDRRFIAETTYDIVRWYRLFREASGAGEQDFWSLLGVWCVANDGQVPSWDEFKQLDTDACKNALNRTMPRAVAQSIPDWMDQLCESEIGERWNQELEALNEEARVVLRANTLKISRDELQHQLETEGTSSKKLHDYPDALVLERRLKLLHSRSFKTGLFEVQDAGSQLIAPFLQAEPGHCVIDACAGGGGKTLHIAALTQNKGRIIALDTEAWKLEEVKKRARRAGAGNIETRLIDSPQVIQPLVGSADRLLLDVPCSGLGVLRRKPDAKWKLSSEFIEDMEKLQQHLLREYCTMLKPGGMMVYSTCSILPGENEMQVQDFLSTHVGFTLLEEKHVWPSEGFDGFYIALIRKE